MKTTIAFLICLLLAGNVLTAQVFDPEKEFEFIKKLSNDNLHKIAAEQFQGFVSRFPNHEYADDALYLGADNYRLAGMIQPAFEAFKQLELSYPQSKYVVQSRYKMAVCQNKLGNFSAAAALFRRIPVLHPATEFASKAYIEAGKACVKAGEDESALNHFRRLILDYPESKERLSAHIEIVDIYFQRNDFESALTEVDGIFQSYGAELHESKVYWLRAQVLEKLGQFNDAEEIYAKLAKDFGNTTAGQRASLKVADFLEKRGDFDAAVTKYDVILSGSDSTLRSLALTAKAENRLRIGKTAEALKLYQKLAMPNGFEQQAALRYKLAQIHYKLESFAEAESTLKKLIANESANKRLALVLLVDVLLRQNKHFDALASLAQLRATTSGDADFFSVYFQEASIYESHLKNYSKAIRVYDEFVERAPGHALADSAQFCIARCYEKLGDFQRANQEYNNYLRQYRGGDQFERVYKRVQLIHKVAINQPADIADISGLLQMSRKSDSAVSELELAKYYIKAGHFLQAASFLQAYLDAGNIATDELKLNLAKAYVLGSLRSLLEDNKEMADVAGANAYWVIADLVADSTDSGINLLVQQELADLYLYNPAITPDSLSGFLTVLGSRVGLIAPSLALTYAKAALQNASDPANDGRLTELFNIVIKSKLPLIERESAAYFKLTLLAKSGADSAAMAMSRALILNSPESNYLPKTLMLRSRLLLAAGDTVGALSDMRRLISTYPYSNVAQRAQKIVAEIKLSLGEYSSALKSYEKYLRIRNNILPAELAAINFNQAKLYELSGNLSKALELYISFIHHNPDSPLIVQARMAIARNAVKNGNENLVKVCYQSVMRSTSEPGILYEAQVALGRYYFENKKFENALTEFSGAKKNASLESEKRYCDTYIIRSEILLGRFSAIASKKKAFRKKYDKTKPEDGLFLRDEGDAHIVAKNFELAKKAFKKLRSNYKKSDLGAWGEFGLGKIYLITNHTEAALEILTKIPASYPESEVAVLAYFNLGDFYYKSGQVQNAILAFKNVIDQPNGQRVEENAVLYLIQGYTDLRMWDQAIAHTRRYLKEYPRSDKAFRKKIDLAQLQMKLKEYERAITGFRQILPYASAEFEAEIQFYIAQCYNESGAYEAAIAEYLKVKYLTKPTKLPWHITALFETGRCLVRTQNFKQAEVIFKRIIKDQGEESNFGRFARKQLQEIAANNVDLGWQKQ